MKAILGFIPFQGKIQIAQNGKSVGWIPQGYQVSLSLPVPDFISLGASRTDSIFPWLPSDSKEKSIAILNDMGLNYLANKKTDEVSGGEWQLVCLAQLLMQDTDIWLLDEPTSFLDIYYKPFIFNILWEKAAQGKTIIFSTHDLHFLPKNSGKILVFDDQYSLEDISDYSVQSVIARLSKK